MEKGYNNTNQKRRRRSIVKIDADLMMLVSIKDEHDAGVKQRQAQVDVER